MVKEVCTSCGDVRCVPSRAEYTQPLTCAKCLAAAELAHLMATTLPSTCPKCKQEYRYPKDQPEPNRCSDCLPKFGPCHHCETVADLMHAQRRFCSAKCEWGYEARCWWLDDVPPVYQETDISRLKRPMQSKQVLAWDRKSSLYIFGDSGLGKTRTIYLVGKQAKEDGCGFTYIRANKFSDMVADTSTTAGRDEFTEWFDEICSVEILCIDEVDKAILNKKAEARFFELVEHRVHHALATVFISNLSVKDLAKGLKVSGAPLLRRITEFFTPINFDLDIKPEAPAA